MLRLGLRPQPRSCPPRGFADIICLSHWTGL